jgi:hypothetical protein
MLAFREWLLLREGLRAQIPQTVLQSYENAFRDELRRLVARTQNTRLKAVLADMVDCPIRSNGTCRSFTDFILASLIRHGVHHRYDLEQALHYVAQKLLMDRTESGEPKASLFTGFEERPDYVEGNPLLARFLRFLDFAVGNIRKGRVPRLADRERLPGGTVSIAPGRRREGDQGGVSPEEIEARPSGEGDLGEMVQDITELLHRKETEEGFPLVNLWKAIMGGMTLEVQRRRFGDRGVRRARQVVVDTIRGYASDSGNATLLRLLGRMTGEEAPRRAQVQQAARPAISDRERDYRSIADVVARFERPVGTADLGRFRRRWLEYKPRDPSSGFRNRLEEVLAAMVADGVLRAVKRGSGATVYSPGPGFGRYREGRCERKT